MYCETLEVVLQQDHRRTPVVLEYVRYPHSIWIQEEAIRIAQFLSARVPNLVDQILPPLASGHTPCPYSLQLWRQTIQKGIGGLPLLLER